MSLQETLEKDLVTAMKAREAEKLSTLRMLKAAITNASIEAKKDKLGDDEVIQIIQRQVKQRKESIESYQKGGKKDLADKEEREISYLTPYLPKQMSDDEIRAEAQKALQNCGAKTKADAGQVMRLLMPVVKGKADGKKVNEIVMSLLS